MKYLNEDIVLDCYLEELEKDNICYLRGRSGHKEKIKAYVMELKQCEAMNKKIMVAKNLWKALFEAAMSSIDPDKRGYDKLFNYFDEYVNFEELIFASDSFYRDHTLHSLWVYFLGEYIMKHHEFDEVTVDMDRDYIQMKTLYNIMKDVNFDDSIKNIGILLNKLCQGEENGEASRCIIALTHDLGYPLKKIEKINKAMCSVLPYFSIKNYDEFAFNYTDIEQIYVTEFIRYLSEELQIFIDIKLKDKKEITDLFIIDKENDIISMDKEKLDAASKDTIKELKKSFITKCYIENNKADYWRYSKDFEEYKHGIMSAFLLMKNVASMSKCSIKESDYNSVDLKNKFLPRDVTKLTIMQAIADHTSNNYQITSIKNPSAFLTFIDELEEFSRLSRANQNREYIEEFCSTNIYMEDHWLNVDFIFDNEELFNLDPERAFKGRCERFLSLFNIPELSENIRLRLRCIGNLPQNNNTYVLEIARKYARIMINNKEMDIPTYLRNSQFYTREEYEIL